MPLHVLSLNSQSRCLLHSENGLSRNKSFFMNRSWVADHILHSAVVIYIQRSCIIHTWGRILSQRNFKGLSGQVEVNKGNIQEQATVSRHSNYSHDYVGNNYCPLFSYCGILSSFHINERSGIVSCGILSVGIPVGFVL